MITARTFWVNAGSRIRHKRGRRRQPRVAVREYRDNHKARLALRSSLRPACRQKRVRSLTPRCANPSVAAVPAICRIGASCKRAGACNTAGQRARSGVKRKRSTRSAKLVLGNGSAHVGLVGARRDREPWSRSGASQIPEAIECSAFTPAAACWSSGDRLAPRGRGLALRRHCDRPRCRARIAEAIVRSAATGLARLGDPEPPAGAPPTRRSVAMQAREGAIKIDCQRTALVARRGSGRTGDRRCFCPQAATRAVSSTLAVMAGLRVKRQRRELAKALVGVLLLRERGTAPRGAI